MKLKNLAILGIVLTSLMVTGCSGKKNDDVINVATCADFVPYEFVENGKVVGLEIELMEKIGEHLGKKVEIKNMDFDGVLSSLASGKVDVGVAAISVTDERKQKFDFTDNMISNNVVIVQKNSSNFNSSADLNSLKIGFQIGTTAQEFVEKTIANQNNTSAGYKDYIQALTDLENGKIDCVIMDQVPATKMLANKSNLKMSTSPLYSDEYAFAAKKGKNIELVNKMNEILKKMKTNGEYDKLINKYLG